MEGRHLEPVPDPEPGADVIPMLLRMDLADNPTILREHWHWMNETDHCRYQQLQAIANKLSEGDPKHKEFILKGMAINSLLWQRGNSVDFDKELVELFKTEGSLQKDTKPERKFRLFRRHRDRAGATIGMAAVSFTLLNIFRNRDRFNGDDAA